MDEQSVKGKVGVGQAAARGFVATALTLSLVPSLAYASPENEEEAPATNEKTSPEAGTTSSNNNNAVVLASAVSKVAATYDLNKIANGTYTGKATADSTDPLNKGDEWDAESYEVSVTVTVADGKITKVEVGDYNALGDDDWDRMDKAVNGYKQKGTTYTGVVSQIQDNGSTSSIDAVSTATISSNAIVTAVDNALQAAYDDQNKQVEDEYTYGYASLTWAEYWAAEGVYNATDTSSSTDSDRDAGNGVYEYDRGGYDVVTRATANHGLHRGSFQSVDVIETAEGVEISPSYYPNKTSFVDTDGKAWTVSGKSVSDGANTYTITGHKVTGTKYVPVKVKTSDLDAFKAKYNFVANGETLQGGFSEGVLSSYSGVVAAVDADTNGLKEVANNDGSFSFGKAATGTSSGIEGQALKSVADVQPSVVRTTEADTKKEDTFHTGSFGEFLRVDINGSYGDLGANMQSVTWTYYGSDATRTNALATYGTKFAADNWMHKSMGIQLGLTESARCQLPENTDGTGYWTLTVHALGYEDYSYEFEATSDNIAKAAEPVSAETKQKLQDLYDNAAALNKDKYTAESWSASAIENELAETKGLLDNENLTESAASEQITHLQAAIGALVKVAPEAGDYVLMNVPYSEFYANETANNSTEVDVFTSATKNKTKGTLAGGTYHTEDGSEITGVTFPVKVTESAASMIDWSKWAAVESQDALATADSHSYVILDEAPASYKEINSTDEGYSFSVVEGAQATSIDGSSEAKFTTESSYGDYELDFAATGSVYAALKDATIYGAVVNTTDGTGYGMRSLENIWKTGKHGFELAWCTGFTEKVHNCPTSSAHYESIMGKTLKDVVVYTSAGTYQITLGDDGIYVPVKTADATVEAADVDIDSTDAVVSATVTLPADFKASYEIDGEPAKQLLAGTMTFSAEGLTPGTHTLTVVDESGKYAAISNDFVVSTAAQVAAYDAEAAQIVAAKDVSDVDFDNYLGNIASVKVNGTSYAAQGRGAAKIINTDGTINPAATSGMGDSAKNVFDGYGSYAIEVSATGYTNNLSFTYNYEADKTALENAVDSVADLKENEYSQASWAKLEEAVTNGKEVLSTVEASDEAVAAAVQAIEDAKAALEASPRIALDELIASAEKLNEADYTKASWAAFGSALDSAKKVAADSSAADAQVTEAKNALVKAQAALQKAATADQKTDLKVEIGKADVLKEADYTAESWAAYQKALKAAVEVVNGEDLSADEVSQALSQLQKARTALVAAEDESGNSSSNGGTTNNVTNNTTNTTNNNAASDSKATGSAKTGDSTLGFAGAFGAIAAAAAAVAAWTRRRILRK